MNTKEKIEVMSAYLAGKKIEILDCGKWGEYTTGEPLWDWASHCYRVKPEPKVIYVNEYKDSMLYAYSNPEKASANCSSSVIRSCVKYQEVIED